MNFSLLSRLSSLRISSSIQHSFHTQASPLLLQVTPVLNAEPMKKKKRIDPAIVRMREDRKRRKIERTIRQLQRHAKKLKPIDEMEVPPKLQKELVMRRRGLPALTYETCQEREALQRAWQIFRYRQIENETFMLERVVASKQKALRALKEESEELYEAAVQLDHSMIPFKISAVTATPPIKEYITPDGSYTDISKKWRP